MPATATKPARAFRDRLLVALFLGGLAAPWFDEFVRTDEQRGPQEREHRTASPRPGLPTGGRAVLGFPAAYEAFFKDSFGLRDVLLRWHSRQSLELLGVSPTPLVLLGKQGWYFYTGNESVETWRGIKPFSEAELEGWKLGLEARRDWLAGLGIEYLFVIAPNKETIYPDYMPDSLERLGPTRLDQFSAYMARNSDLSIVDLRGPLCEARKQDGPQSHLYLEEGTHWNARGALVAYRAILERLAQRWPALAPLAPEQWQLVDYPPPGDTWASNMYIGDLSRQREVGAMRAPGTARSRQLDAGRAGRFGPGRKLVWGTADPEQPRALLFHDSFGPYVEALLSEHFSSLECEWTYEFDSREVLDFQPRIVIELWVERTLAFYPPSMLLPKLAERADAEFARARNVCFVLDPSHSAPPQTQGKLEIGTVEDERGAAFRLDTRTGGDSLLLPELGREAKGRLLVRLSIDSPARGSLDIFYLLEGDTGYTRQHNCLVALEKGPNEICIRMPEAGVIGRLRLRPAYSAQGPYLLRALEIRSTVGP